MPAAIYKYIVIDLTRVYQKMRFKGPSNDDINYN